MKGSKSIQVSNNRARFRFTLNRNITIVRGDSGTGKTTLYDMIAEYTRLGENSGVQVSAPCPCVALTDMDWQNQLSHIHASVVFIDEGMKDLASDAFASVIQNTDNYYVIFNRENLHSLPYSVEEIYTVKTSNRYHTFEKLYRRQEGCIYSAAPTHRKVEAGAILTEDSRAGLQLYQHLYDGTSVRCESAGSNSGIFSWLQQHMGQGVFVIADGAAFGSEIDRVMKLQRQFPNQITVCLPESFEWLILQSGIAPIQGLSEMLDNPVEQIECCDYFSWERFFTDYLVQHSTGTYYAYSKSRLHHFYTVRENMEKVVAVIARNMPNRVSRDL